MRICNLISFLFSNLNFYMECGFGFLSGSVVKNLPAIQEMQEMWVQFPGQEDPLEEGLANPLQYSCLENSMDRGPGRLPSMGLQRVGHDWNYWAHTKYYSILSATKMLSSSWDN